MKCDDIQLQLCDYVDGTLTPAETERIRAHLATCPACAREAEAQRRLTAAFEATPAPQPGPRVAASFHTWLDSEREAASFRARSMVAPRTSWLRALMGPGLSAAAACVLFVAGVVVSPRLLRDDRPTAREVATAEEVKRLRDEVTAMNQAVAWKLLDQGSTGERLQNVRALQSAPDRAPSINELLGVLAYDTSVTVRQNAVYALGRYAEDPMVRRAVASALPRESSPFVQLAMIDLLANTRDPLAANALEEFARSESPQSEVRDAAHQARARML